MLQRTMLQRTNAITNSFCKQNQDATTETYGTTNAEEYYRPTQHARAHDVSGLPALNRASVIIFLIVFRAQLPV
jgi:hypothetical protein